MSLDVLDQIASALEGGESPAGELRLPVGTRFILEELTLFDSVNDETMWAAALLLCVMERGGTCLPLRLFSEVPEFVHLPDELRALSVDEWREKLSGDVFGDGEDHVRPLVVLDDRLYFDRYVRLERDVAQRLLSPLSPDALREPAAWPTVVGDYFNDDELSSAQRQAALGLFRQRVTVLAGGPGTGKTFTVAKMLVALYRATNGQASVKICAPTGKAAQRVRESLVKVLNEVAPDLAGEVMRRITPTTIHKLLGITPLSSRRRRSDPLHVDVVICDETSMVDIALLDELLRALSDETRLVVVGDPNQLQSVDVGTVMSDLVEAVTNGLPGTQLTTVFRVLEGADLSAGDRNLMLQFFNHIRGDEVDEALGILDAGTNILRLVDVNEKGEMMDGGNDVLNSVIARAENLINVAHRSSSSQDALTELTSVMVLAAQHRGLLSRTWWVEKVGAQVGFRDDTVPSMVGLPVLITATDTANGVTNGDTGLIITSDGQTLYQPATVVTTSESDDVSASRLPPTAIHSWQPWWAMTIHKSQGSEFDEVIVSITPQTRLLSKELLYTAVTRAKKRVTIVGRRADVEKALKTPAHRYSGLAEIINSLMSA